MGTVYFATSFPEIPPELIELIGRRVDLLNALDLRLRELDRRRTDRHQPGHGN